VFSEVSVKIPKPSSMASHDDAFTTFAQDDEEEEEEDDRQKQEVEESASSNKTTPNHSQQHEDDPYQSFIQEMKSLLVSSSSSSSSSSNQLNSHASPGQSSSNTLWRSETLPRSDETATASEEDNIDAVNTSTTLNTQAVDEHTNNDDDDVNEEELERMASEWTEYWDDKLKRPYFHHHPTGTVQWRPPTHWHNLALSIK